MFNEGSLLLIFLDLRNKYLYLMLAYLLGAVLLNHLLQNRKIEKNGINKSCRIFLLLISEGGEL